MRNDCVTNLKFLLKFAFNLSLLSNNKVKSTERDQKLLQALD